ncbi:MAG TPA: histidine phosphatase family protein [Phycisphaerae bacterium]|nr:histidine phosphatase family protein [Phycisphaerae bacterium]
MMDATGACQLVVVRHGETVWNTQGLQQGQMDSDLTDLGRAQARALADRLTGGQFDALYSSDLGRALETARIIADRAGLDVETDLRLRERDLGILQGISLRQFEQKHREEHARFRSGDPDYVIPSGESVRQRHERCVACATELAGGHAGRRILIVTHGGILDSFFRHALELPLTVPRRFSLFNASINSFTVTNGQWRLKSWGHVEHLEGIGTMDDW